MTAGTGAPARAYSSTVVAPWLAVASVAAGAATGTGLSLAGPDPLAGLLAGAVVMVAGLYLATVRLAAGNGRIVVGHGPWARTGRVIRVSTPDPGGALAVIQPGPTQPGETRPAWRRPETEET